MREDNFRYLYRHNWSLIFCLYELSEVGWSVCHESRFALGGMDQRLAAFETKESVMELSLVTVLISVRIEESADGKTHSQSESGRFVECNRH